MGGEAVSEHIQTRLDAGLRRFQVALLAEIQQCQALQEEALRAHDHAKARATRIKLERATRALRDVAQFSLTKL